MILYIRIYMDTGRLQVDEESLKRTAPLSFNESVMAALKLSMQTPLSFIVGVLPRTIYAVIMAAVTVRSVSSLPIHDPYVLPI